MTCFPLYVYGSTEPGQRNLSLWLCADVVIKTQTDIFVLELKVDDTVENALSQIDDKGYAIPYEADASTSSAQVPRKVTKCGVCISSDHRNITHWRITDAEGNVIEDKDFLCK